MNAPTSRPAIERFKETARRLGIRRFWKKPSPPTNLRARDVPLETIREEARYGVNCGRAYLAHFEQCGFAIEGTSIAEVGPGVGFGAMAFLAAHGARVSVIDRWLAPWQPDYHCRYYQEVAKEIGNTPNPDIIAPLAKVQSYAGGPIDLIPIAAEMIGETKSRRFDAIVSNAVLEHVYDLEKTAGALFSAIRPGGISLHQIDYRDHRNFDRPLDHLLFDRSVWNRMSSLVHWEYGSQRRPADYAAAFRLAGFEIVSYQCTDRADAEYVQELRKDLATGSPAIDPSDDSIFELGGHYILRRPDHHAYDQGHV